MAVTMNAQETEWVKKLQENGQGHLIPDGAAEADLKRLIGQVMKADASYPGGVLEYLNRARKLLADSRNEVNPFEGCVPEEPDGERLILGTSLFKEMEDMGVEQIAQTCFVMVAGGLGERLGYPGIKISLPAESSTGMTYMELYARHILAFQEFTTRKLKRKVTLPLVIMTSDDTNKATCELLESNANFGLTDVTIVKQEKVPSLSDNEAKMTVGKDIFELETKPHGHGDVHTLLAQHGFPKKWTEQGYKWLVFFQDTNGLVFRCIPAVLGVSAKHNFVMNTIAVPRKPGEAVGGICRLRKADKSSITMNVEYNQLDPLLKGSGNAQGDVADASGNSKFPGNTNVFIMNIPRYADVLNDVGGAIPEFVNPKYADASKTVFKSPTRLECMMQDFPKLLRSEDRVGFTEMERWFCFSTVKNNRADAAVKAKNNMASESAFSGESDMYATAARLLRMAATESGLAPIVIPEPKPTTYGGVAYVLGPRVVVLPSFAVSFEELKNKLAGAKGKPLTMTDSSTLILEGDVEFKGLRLDGTLVARAAPGKALKIEDLTVSNKGWELKALTPEEEAKEPPSTQIRGYKLVKHEQAVL